MNSDALIQDLSVLHHSWLLSDSNRLIAFKKAIEGCVNQNSIAVDIGTGTGILASYAAKATKKNVYAIEYFDFGINLAEKLFQKNGINN